MTTHYSTAASNANQHAQFADDASRLTMATLALSIPVGNLRHVLDTLDMNPKDGPRYAGGGMAYDWSGTSISGTRYQDRELRFSYSVERVHTGILAVQEEYRDAVVDAASTKAILTLARDVEKECRANGRLTHFDRTHDIGEFASGVVSAANWVRGFRTARHRCDEARIFGGKAGSRTDLRLYYGPARNLCVDLAADAIERWLPAMQNIISHLPASEQEGAAREAQLRLQEYLMTLAKLHTVLRRDGDEYRRWSSGFGAVDMAVLAGASMVRYAKDLSDRTADDGTRQSLARSLRARTNVAWDETAKALAVLSRNRFDVLSEQAWYHHKADMVGFARATGGIAPDLEVLYHTKGSKFIGY